MWGSAMEEEENQANAAKQTYVASQLVPLLLISWRTIVRFSVS